MKNAFDLAPCTCTAWQVAENAPNVFAVDHTASCELTCAMACLPDVSNMRPENRLWLQEHGVPLQPWAWIEAVAYARHVTNPVYEHARRERVAADEAVGTILESLPIALTLANPPLPNDVLLLLAMATGTEGALRDALRVQWHLRPPYLSNDWPQWIDCVLEVIAQHDLLFQFNRAVQALEGTSHANATGRNVSYTRRKATQRLFDHVQSIVEVASE